ncbi:MAG TPA: redoxin domain-containing protein [Bacteroidota bacterium]|nr:redoxin domain-containing protein [Bacteroidota bacterium]
MELEQANTHSPELYGDFWFNSEPVSIRDLRGSVILVDFFDYTCNNWIRTLPYLKDWHRKYREFGIVVVGVHTPQFSFAKKPEVLQKALEQAGVEHTIVVDNEALLWSAFGSRVWPTKFLVDKDGFIRYTQQGEGNYQQFERALQQLIVHAGFRGRLPDLTEPLRETDYPGSLVHRQTGEIQLGYLRGALGNKDGYSPESTLDYVDPGIYLPERYYAKGKWLSTREHFSFNGESGETGSVTIQYEAAEVNAVLNSPGSVAEIIVRQDGAALSSESYGEDVVKGNDGASLVLVESPKMYNLVRNREYGSHILSLTVSSPRLEIYTFSFTTAVVSALIQSN